MTNIIIMMTSLKKEKNVKMLSKTLIGAQQFQQPIYKNLFFYYKVSSKAENLPSFSPIPPFVLKPETPLEQSPALKNKLKNMTLNIKWALLINPLYVLHLPLKKPALSALLIMTGTDFGELKNLTFLKNLTLIK
jgi:hypothetical protein